jgi:spore coat protein H
MITSSHVVWFPLFTLCAVAACEVPHRDRGKADLPEKPQDPVPGLLDGAASPPRGIPPDAAGALVAADAAAPLPPPPDATAPEVSSGVGSSVDTRVDPAGLPDAAPDGVASAPLPDLLGTVFSPTVLHDVQITVAAQYLTMLENDRVNRVPATVVYDGKTLTQVGIRKKGSFGSFAKLSEKAAFSLNLDEFVAGQKLEGLDKLALNNCRQDGSFLAEHIGYEVHRRAGTPAPFTAHAVLTFNGVVKGLFVVREGIDKQFLRRNFGKADDEGNLYEGGYLEDTDFVLNPERMELKREVEEARKRDDLVALARLVRDTPVATWEAAVKAQLDLDQFITGYAIDAVLNHWDNYAFNINNYYLYHHVEGKFAFIPHGMDSLFAIDLVFPDDVGLKDPFASPLGRLAQRLRAIPALDQRYRAAVARVARELLDPAALDPRIDQVSRTIRSTARTERALLDDIKKFDMYLPVVRRFLASRRTALAR